MFATLLRALRARKLVPTMSDTERAALEAGDVWIDGDLFSGRPRFRQMLEEPYPALTKAERAFLEGPVEEVCALVDRQEVERTKELSEETWAALRQHRFFGLALPVEHGGHGFSNLALSTLFGKLGTCSMALQSVVLIPNSVGPGELLAEVGTEEQKRYYLPRLARGDEIPCFALTEPEAGSDAGSLTSRGVLFRDGNGNGNPDGDGELMIRLDWEKRYITLAPIATLLGLAFQLEDPDGLLEPGQQTGITCALVPTHLDGVEIGRRHDPLGIPFPNGPTSGRGVVIPASQIIGGIDQAGRGWRMLMEALSGGRAISLPAGAAAGAKHIARVAGAYSVVRQQFGLSIGRFEGIEEPLARIAGTTYLIDAARIFTCGAIDSGHRPAVISAIMKYNSTELVRSLALDGMDVLGGAAICRGPRNLMSDAHTVSPIGITVEGANILTRTLIVFGQGAVRSHPHAHALLESMRNGDARDFRRALFGQLGHLVSSFLRSTFYGLSGGRLAGAPVSGPTAVYFRRLSWAAARFACASDLAMMAYGGKLKIRGKLSGRFADHLSWMVLAFSVLRRWEAEGRRPEDLPLVHWAAQTSLARIQEAWEGLLQNFDAPALGLWMRGPARWWARLVPMGKPPSDHLGAQVAAVLRQPGEQRDRLIADLYRSADPEGPIAVLEDAFHRTVEAAPVIDEIRRAVRRGTLPKASPESLLEEAESAGVITTADRQRVEAAIAARRRAIQVDDFSLDELRAGYSRETSEETLEPVAAAG